MTDLRVRSGARRVVAALLVVGVLAGTGGTFPRDATGGGGWSFLLHDLGLLAHALVGVAVLVDTAVLAARAAAEGPVVLRGAVLAGLLAVAAAVAGGVAYVGDSHGDGALSVMTAGWIAALLAYAVAWRVASVRVRTSPGSPGRRRA